MNVATITLDRPALDPAMAANLRGQAEALAARDDVGAVVLRGTGTTFLVGGDLAFMRACGDGVETALRAMADDLHAAVLTLARLDAPVIAAVNGVAAGAGLSLVCAADLALCAASAQFKVAYPSVGLAPDGGLSWTLPRIVGQRRAAELMLLDERFGASEALALGIVGRVVPDGELDASVAALAERLAAGPAGAHGWIKRLLRTGASTRLDVHLDREAAAIAASAASPEGLEGVSAFLDKRTPQFRAPLTPNPKEHV
jgi:2-(1,2-epoxy-1,2-dihydrophenyl)acetyl-CoA isomerase